MAISLQILILREFEASLLANELVYGFVLAFWLLGSSLGSWLVKKISRPDLALRAFIILFSYYLSFCLPGSGSFGPGWLSSCRSGRLFTSLINFFFDLVFF